MLVLSLLLAIANSWWTMIPSMTGSLQYYITIPGIHKCSCSPNKWSLTHSSYDDTFYISQYGFYIWSYIHMYILTGQPGACKITLKICTSSYMGIQVAKLCLETSYSSSIIFLLHFHHQKLHLSRSEWLLYTTSALSLSIGYCECFRQWLHWSKSFQLLSVCL